VKQALALGAARYVKKAPYPRRNPGFGPERPDGRVALPSGILFYGDGRAGLWNGRSPSSRRFPPNPCSSGGRPILFL